MEHKNVEFDIKLKEEKQVVEGLKYAVRDLEDEKHDLEDQNFCKHEKVEKLEIDLIEAKGVIDDLTCKVHDGKVEINTLNTVIVAHEKECETITFELNQVRIKLESETEYAKHKAEKLEHLEDEHEHKCHEISVLHKKVKHLHEDIDDYKADITDLQNRHAKLLKDLEVKD